MTFFYDLNKKLDEIRATPSTTHGQLNERDMSRAAKGYEKYGKEGMEALAKAGREGKDLDKVRAKYNKYDDKPVDEGLGQVAKKVGSMAKKVGGAVLDKLGHGSDEELLKDLQKKAGIPPHAQHGKKNMAQSNEGVDKEAFAALAPPKDKITFADKIAGAKKEVDEMLGDVAAEAMKSALSPKQKKIDMNKNGKLDANDFAMLRKGGKGREETDEGWDDMLKDVEKRRGQMKTGEKIKGHKGEIEKTATGIRHTRSYDAKTGETDTGDDGEAQQQKRGRGRPKKGDAPRQERTTAKSRKADRTAHGQAGFAKAKKTNEGENQSDDVKQAMAVLKKAGYKISKAADGAEELDEKAVSKKQQRFMGMVHATQKGEKAPSKEVAKVAKSMGKKDAEDFAATKHKGLPEKAPKKKKEKTEEAGGTGTPTASSGFSFGKGIYDSMNHELETMIAESMTRLDESMSINMSNSTEGGKSLTITASDEDAVKLATLLKSAGLGGGDSEGYGGSGYQSACGCGTPDCSCGDQEMDEAYGDNAVSQNAPDYPTDTETSDDALQYAGGLNKPKSTGQTTVPVIASQEERQESYAEAEEDAIKRMMEMAGIKEGKKPDFLDVDKDGNKKEPFKKAVDDKKEKKVDEGILASTANLWKEYKGQAGV